MASRLSGRPTGEVALEQHAIKPDQWGGALKAELMESGAIRDAELVEAAQRLMELADSGGSQAGKYLVDLRGAQGIQVGDHGAQTNTFNNAPSVAR